MIKGKNIFVIQKKNTPLLKIEKGQFIYLDFFNLSRQILFLRYLHQFQQNYVFQSR